MKRTIIIIAGILFLLAVAFYFGYVKMKKHTDETVVVLDPGHGGKYPGFSNKTIVEKEVVWGVSQYLKEELEKKGYKVYVTRDGDTECSKKGYEEDLTCRPKFARKMGADLFVSIHANAFVKNSEVRGIETFYFTPFQDKEAAHAIARSLSKETGMPIRFTKFANYRVLRESIVPSTLIEIGYLTNEEDAKLLQIDEFKRKTAIGIAKGIEVFLHK
ncbi:N-acetylmuramoyl-L-alanine amidase [Bacillus sp. 165]|uniref:N-acetylmuramoyl-L-alanine amidase family protein n=1 Tax=Bacillus sp. 165 TaxID=1529117 RepID=UPI001ADA230E|nr:N-acetylmuramoyl-L-alanine amidase [Bacillus sp. 165]MBO9129804.1 N-acetylmuramoyl-L-alanine amidase [Bacillus sp. 165]